MSTNSIVFHNRRLSYVGQEAAFIPAVLPKMYGGKAEILDLSYNSLVSIKEISQFPYLQELILDNNQLDDSLELVNIPSLHTLSLNKNKITDLEFVLGKIQSCFPNLKFLSMLGNPACPDQLSNVEKDEDDYQRYRCYVLYKVPQLQFLDSRPVNHNEKVEAALRGQYMKVARPSPKYNNLAPSPDDHLLKYTPLPKATGNSHAHQGVYGKCRFKYSGKHSEGNRFIRNHEL